MSAAREYPHGNSWERWSLNAGVYEEHRYECARTAERMRAEGNVTGAERFEAQAEEWRSRRDADQRQHEMRTLNRQAHSRHRLF